MQPAQAIEQRSRLSEAARGHFLRSEVRPTLVSDWLETVMIHFEVSPEVLQRETPFELDCFGGRAYVTLVAFTMIGLRSRRWPRAGRLFLRPIGTHEFLNIRTYVRVNGESGIYFLVEYLPNRLSVLLGPSVYGLPYRFGRIEYHNSFEADEQSGVVRAGGGGGQPGVLRYRMRRSSESAVAPAGAGSLTEFLMERYSAFTRRGEVVRRFRVWHEPWPQVAAVPEILEDTLLEMTGSWHASASLHSGQVSPGVCGVWIGSPRRIDVVSHGDSLKGGGKCVRRSCSPRT